jgi:hypothetical protein
MWRKAFLVAMVSISTLPGADKVIFRPRPASEYEAKVTLDQVTIAAEPYDTEEKSATAFGKLHPPKHGVLPVLLVIENQRQTPLDARQIRVMYRARGEQEIEATPSAEVRYAAGGPTKPKLPGTTPYPIPLPSRRKKGPLSDEVIEERAFAAKMIPPGESATGFVYFQTEWHGGVTITIAGLRDSSTGQELFYFELPLTHR